MSTEKTIAVYDSLSAAETAVMLLDRKGYVMAQVSILDVEPEAGEEGKHLVVVEGDEKELERASTLLHDSATQVTRAESAEDVLERGEN
jgi:uncharacterized protein YifE (UPF0438 family)